MTQSGPYIPAPIHEPWRNWVPYCSAVVFSGGVRLQRQLNGRHGYYAFSLPDVWTTSSSGYTGSFAEFESTQAGEPFVLEVTAFDGAVQRLSAFADEPIVAEFRLQEYGQRFGPLDVEWRGLVHVAGAFVFQTQAMARIYTAELSNFVDRMAHGFGDSRRVQIAAAEAYYPFEAAIADAVRFYELSRAPLWRLFGGTGTRPRSFQTTVQRLAQAPAWVTATAGDLEVLKEHRDCLAHYATAAAPWPLTHVARPDGCWRFVAPIPDNPEAKARRHFTFSLGMDALDYARTEGGRLLSFLQELERVYRPGDAL